ncbi:MAG TPA: hypothetical protein PKA42_01015 [Candidatus Paceibacterota bacterium]|nr:hypothetical protein [Candidatus Paceibacterota bacterium]
MKNESFGTTNSYEKKEIISNAVELMSFPKPVHIPAGTTLDELAISASCALPNIKEADEYNIPEAYIAVLERGAEPQEYSVECVGCRFTQPPNLEGKKAAEVAAELVSNVDPSNPWRMATMTEMMAFVTAHPNVIGNKVLVTLGETDLNHYPMCIYRSREGLKLDVYRGGLSHVGTIILLSRVSSIDSVTVSPSSDEAQLTQIEELKSYTETVNEFYRASEQISDYDRERLRSITKVTQLLGEEYQNLYEDCGDIVAYQIISAINSARRPPNNPGPGGLYVISPEQVDICVANVERNGQSVDSELREKIQSILRDPALLNSEMMNLRGKAQLTYAVLKGLIKKLENDPTFPLAELEKLVKSEKALLNDIGYMIKNSLLVHE